MSPGGKPPGHMASSAGPMSGVRVRPWTLLFFILKLNKGDKERAEHSPWVFSQNNWRAVYQEPAAQREEEGGVIREPLGKAIG